MVWTLHTFGWRQNEGGLRDDSGANTLVFDTDFGEMSVTEHQLGAFVAK